VTEEWQNTLTQRISELAASLRPDHVRDAAQQLEDIPAQLRSAIDDSDE
jgi:hypothetical protein